MTAWRDMTPAQKASASERNRQSKARRRAEQRTEPKPLRKKKVTPRQHYAKPPMKSHDKALPGVLRVVMEIYGLETDEIKRAEIRALNKDLFG